jgi:hypothetical protein
MCNYRGHDSMSILLDPQLMSSCSPICRSKLCTQYITCTPSYCTRLSARGTCWSNCTGPLSLKVNHDRGSLAARFRLKVLSIAFLDLHLHFGLDNVVPLLEDKPWVNRVPLALVTPGHGSPVVLQNIQLYGTNRLPHIVSFGVTNVGCVGKTALLDV